jgi:uncharacterized protein (TIGR00251 family)
VAEWQGGRGQAIRRSAAPRMKRQSRLAKKQNSKQKRAVIKVHLQPRASKTEVVGRHGDAIKIRVQAPPVDGAANTELIRFLARTLGLPRAAIQLAGGAGGRLKRIEVEGRDLNDVEKLLGIC